MANYHLLTQPKLLLFHWYQFLQISLFSEKNRNVTLKVVDSRLNSIDCKIYAYIEKHLTSQEDYTLPDVLVFKKLDDEVITLNETPVLLFAGTNNNGDSEITLVTWSREKGTLLDLTNDALEINEEYFAEVIFVLEE